MKTTACSDVADCIWLTGDEASAILAELAVDDAPLHLKVARLRGRVSAARTHLLLEQVELRRRATEKFSRAHEMFFTRVGLEQATDEWIAAYKANRMTGERAALSLSNGPGQIVDLCCGIGGDLAALVNIGPATGVDLDPVTAYFAAANTGAVVQSVDAAQADLADATAIHIDPDRRADGARTTTLEAFQPSLAVIEQLIARTPNAGVKLAPATRVPADWEQRCELEWISRDRECRQLVAWHGQLAQHVSNRRATVLSSRSDIPARTIIGIPKHSTPIAPQVDRYVFDVDPAVLAAHLKGAVAAEHGLNALAAGATYLTGPNAIVGDAALACFEVAEVLPMETRKLARHLAERGIGRLEIKKRGVEIDPERLRRELRLRGDNAATLLIANSGGRTVVILSKRVVQ